jgi:hypothetical protein
MVRVSRDNRIIMKSFLNFFNCFLYLVKHVIIILSILESKINLIFVFIFFLGIIFKSIGYWFGMLLAFCFFLFVGIFGWGYFLDMTGKVV